MDTAHTALSDRLVVQLALDYHGGQLSGTVAPPGQVPLGFSGWIGLLAVLDHLRHDTGPALAPRGPSPARGGSPADNTNSTRRSVKEKRP